MDIPKRTEHRPPRPPVPKFRHIGAGTDSPDFLPPPKTEESSFIALSFDNTSETSIEDFNESYFTRKRISAIVEEITNQIALLGLSEDLLKIGLSLLKSELLEGLKSKKYKAIAVAIIIASLKQINAPITQKEILSKTSVSEKQIKKILLQIHNPYNLQAIVYSFIKQISSQIGLNDKFITFCLQMFNEINLRSLIQGEHENVIAGAIIKYCGDIIFADRGGIIAQVIADNAKCSLGPLKNFLKKIEQNLPLTYSVQQIG
ncbi:unnamed protein product (macronuclear) [Paramecium tetraurelia]|uniref:Cyclin N-terminal domain-containing protein n=1 Tax=Paramecium tetraurelia TaxID=5888 RepID=A0CPI0_PARTE|nr:uncharacterized protein GSPATT00009089001 [Paramecium tetraurelia]CAK72697.1 unnamed protein product [Paramecium tetraurelia]|eukprot:XP_001440094.1 hypothetical protein (macronuclear) [Paramecium tetraurelia strain d4-2]